MRILGVLGGLLATAAISAALWSTAGDAGVTTYVISLSSLQI